jgi:DNA-binding transcriptional ArsR family regulator
MSIEYIEADDVRRRPFRAAIAPLPSLHIAVRDAAGADRAGTPPAWCAAIRAQLHPEDYETLAPLARPGPALVPDVLIGLAEAPGESFKDGIERMLASPLDDLVDEIASCSSATGNPGWIQAEREPSRWVRRYVATLLRAWKGFGPIWRQGQPALDREVERVGIATALDAQLELLDGLVVRGGVEDGRWSIPCEFDNGRLDLPDTGLVLVPLLAGHRASIFALTGKTLRRVAYPVPSAASLHRAESCTAPLEGLLGIPRAQILRAVACPTSIGRLAEALRVVPSAATHHVSALEGAGLVTRERSGRTVLVRRTIRGEALLELYDEAAPRTAARRGPAS